MRGLRLRRRKAAADPAAPAAPPAPAAAPLPRPPAVTHHWLAIHVLRPGPAAAVPVGGARITVRPYFRGAMRPEEPVARGTSAPDGTFAVSLPAGRYAIYAQAEGEGKAVTVALHHPGRATLMLESLARRATLEVVVTGLDGAPLAEATVDLRVVPTLVQVARMQTDSEGRARIALPPGAYEVRVNGASARTFLEADTTLRIASEPLEPAELAPAPISRYAQKARAATTVVAPLDAGTVRDEVWN